MILSVSKRKKQCQVKQPTRNWLDLPSDVTSNILSRVGVFDVLEKAEKVCTTWRKICKEDPTMWRVIYMNNDSWCPDVACKMCKDAVDRSQGQLVDITMVNFSDDKLLEYIAERSSKLRRLEIAYSSYRGLPRNWTSLMKFPLLEELKLKRIAISKEAIETVGRYCPMLKTLKLIGVCNCQIIGDEKAIAIGENLPQLRHLEFTRSQMSSIGLQAILDGCRHLESLDLRESYSVDRNGELGKRCLKQIKCLKLNPDKVFPYNNGEFIFEEFTPNFRWGNMLLRKVYLLPARPTFSHCS